MINFIKTGLSALLVLSVCFLWSTPQYGNLDVPDLMDVSIGYLEGEMSDVEFDGYFDQQRFQISLDLIKTELKDAELRESESSDLTSFLMDLYSVELEGMDIVFGDDPIESVGLHLDEFSFAFSDLDWISSPENDILEFNSLTGELTIRGLELKLNNEFYNLISMLGGKPGVLEIDRFNAEVSYNRRGLITLDGSLSTPYGKASVEGKVLFDDRYPERSPIRKFELTVQNLSEELQEALEEWERESGSSLPRKGRNIEIIITGTLGEPLMDGKPLIGRSYDEWDYGEDAEEAWDYNDKSAEIILVAYDWVYPDMDNPMGAWKFSSDGTFNYSTTAFGGMTRTGTWKDVGDSKVELDYDDGGTGELEITSSTTFKVGSTTYNRY